ncbi:hypothetical protein [Pseudopedobacter beijingensis]|uniref:Uncharacterized protein n=1 Tax=Pseudopedobacter beijingensis TaxID=1207056 RepID=A0ABW4IIS7_9SPHI
MSNTPRPSRGATPGTVSQTIAAGPDQSPMNLPAVNPGGVALPASSIAATLQIVNDIDELEGRDDPDTHGFLYNDNNIFETGGLNKSDPNLFKRRKSGIMTPNKVRPIAYIPKFGDIIFHKGEEYEFLGYLGDNIELEPEELASFQAYGNGEYSEFFGKAFKNFTKNLKNIAKNLPGKFGLFRKRIKGSASFDGYDEVEYFIGSDPMEAEFIGKAFKAIGKGVKKAVQAVGKGVKKATQAVGKAGKAVGKGVAKGVKGAIKGVGNAVKAVGKTIEKGADWYAKNFGNGQQEASPYESPLDWSQQTAAIDTQSAPGFMPYENGDYYQDENGQIVYANAPEGTPITQAKSNTNLIIAIAIAVLVIGGLFILKFKK